MLEYLTVVALHFFATFFFGAFMSTRELESKVLYPLVVVVCIVIGVALWPVYGALS